MDAFLAIVTTFPVAVYTVLLGASVVYWLFVVVGAVHVDGGDGALDGVSDALDVGGHHVEAGHGDAGDAGDVGDAHAPGGLAGMLAALKLRSAPATVVLSVLVLFAWILAVLGMQAATAIVPLVALGAAKAGIFVLAPLLALFPTSLAIRPLAKVFAPSKAVASKDLVGQLCTIRTGTVTDRFGEATLEDGGAGVVVRVRVESGQKLARGQQAVIVGYDASLHEFTVAPMDDVLDDDGDAKISGSGGAG